jgi:hypothetical protein
MKPYQGLFFAIFAALALVEPLAAQRPSTALPAWLGNHTEVLPPIDEKTRLEVRQLLETMDEHSFEHASDVNADYVKAAKRFVELGELSGQAMLWTYLDEPVRFDPDTVEPRENTFMVWKNGQTKDRLLSLLRDDPTLEQWLLPLVRLRMKWFEKAIAEERVDEVISTSEIGGIMGYLYAHGETSDLEAIYRIVEDLKRTKNAPSVIKNHPTLASQAQDIAQSKESYRVRAEPMYERQRFILKSLGIEATAPAIKKQANPDAISPPSSANQITGTIHSATTPQTTQAALEAPRRDWIVRLFVVIAAALGALWLTMRKAK